MSGFSQTFFFSLPVSVVSPLRLTPLSFFLSPYRRLSVGHAPLAHTEKPVTIRQYLGQLSKHRNFMWFVSMNLVQVRC